MVADIEAENAIGGRSRDKLNYGTRRSGTCQAMHKTTCIMCASIWIVEHLIYNIYRRQGTTGHRIR